MPEADRTYEIANITARGEVQLVELHPEKGENGEKGCTARGPAPDGGSPGRRRAEAHSVAWSPDRSHVAVLCSDNALRVYSTSGDGPLPLTRVVLPRKDSPDREMVFLRSNLLLWASRGSADAPWRWLVVGQDGSCVYLLEAGITGATRLEIVHERPGASVLAVACNYDASRVAVAYDDGFSGFVALGGSARAIELDTGAQETLTGLAYHPLSKTALAGHDRSGGLYAWNTTAGCGTPCAGVALRQSAPVRRLAWPQMDKRHIATLGADDVVRVYNLVRQQVVLRFARPGATELCFAGSLGLVVKARAGISVHRIESGAPVVLEWSVADAGPQKALGTTLVARPHVVPGAVEKPERAEARVTERLAAILSTPQTPFAAARAAGPPPGESTATLIDVNPNPEPKLKSALAGAGAVSTASLADPPPDDATLASLSKQLSGLRRQVRGDLQGLQVEMVRQFCIQAGETEALLAARVVPLLQQLFDELQSVRAEASQLRGLLASHGIL